MKRFLCLALTCLLIFPLSVFVVAETEKYYLPGDTDNDGSVTAADARTILRLSVHLETWETLAENCRDAENYDYRKAADPNRDGKYDASDARTALRVAVNLDRLPAARQHLHVNTGIEPESLDPAFASAYNDFTIVQHLFAGLTKYEQDENGKYYIVADCAKSLPVGTVAEDGKVTYVFELKDNLKWSDGTPLTAADFVYAWNRAAAPDTYAAFNYLFYDIDGYMEMQNDPSAKLNVHAQGNKLTVVTAWPCMYLFDLLTNSIFMPVKQSVVENNTNWANEASSFVCNGAYTISEWSDDNTIQLTKNNHYHNAANIEKITFSVTDDTAAVLSAFQTGNLHFTNNIEAAQTYGSSDPAFRNLNNMGTYYYVFNANHSLLPRTSTLKGSQKEKAEAEIRRALALLINRQSILESVGLPAENAASTFVANTVADAGAGELFYENAGPTTKYHGYYDTLPLAYQQNCNAAVATLRKYYSYNTSTGKFTDFPGAEILHNGEGHKAIAQSIQRDLAAYGLQISIKETDWATLLENRANGDFEVIRDGWIADYNDPVNFLEMFYSKSGNNSAQLGNGAHASVGAYSLDLTPLGLNYKVINATWEETYDILISLIWSVTDVALRYRLMHMAEDLLMETGVVMPLYYFSTPVLQNTNVKGITTTPYGYPSFTNAVIY
ncbi:MAG: hypothetical protein IJO14_10470 [Clostridia bacterium]|nr:hypothetical protein [Clostridia bacterium]